MISLAQLNRTAVGFTVSVSSFWMSWRLASQLTELLEVIHRQLVAQEVEQNILQSATVRNQSG